MPVSFEILFFDHLSLGGRSLFFSQRSNALSRSCTFHSCSFWSLPADAVFLGAITLPSFALLTFFLVVFCLATVNKKITRLMARPTRLNFGLLPTLIEPAQEGKLDIFFFLLSDTVQMESLFAFIATHPLLLVDTISVDEPIANVLHFKPHLVWCLNRTNETLPLKGFHTSGMFILIQVLGKFHSKEENIKRVRVMVWVDLRSRPQAGSFVFLLHPGYYDLVFLMVKGEGVLGPRKHYSLNFLLENCLLFVTRSTCTLLPASTCTPVQAGNNFQLGAKPLISPIMSYHCACM